MQADSGGWVWFGLPDGQGEDSRSSPQKDMGPFDLGGHPLMVVL